MSIISHVVVGTNDLERARVFYDAVLKTLGVKRVVNLETASLWGTESPEFMVTRPGNGLPSTYANGGTIGFAAPNRAAVHAFHEAAIKARCQGRGTARPAPVYPHVLRCICTGSGR
ncbi:glyoxalase/bleomycin resistance protein/dioxygenase (plasmid) [Cupriavidus necator N-1]|uniref:Glyoxalase/bleomycin resistance protein/dioxygenase n=1 Tax=Cupriavidus necator (strain ATCC 43291 / DSM 13513 / CCUG 52238 / LMG 8453 / N-1) TaxID=1042878 RepID=F8GVC6_CUPNN|nr:VOC family protein [Cupriavidus necator]AEI82626.1 glyoxalase/bleomycin resistance protein/dioxygenase [Cupriavidus necator N-1]MDX6007623.1 VOC family protein [Cupriavidus necator]